MKRFFLVLVLIGLISTVNAENFPIGFGVATGYSVGDPTNFFFVEGTGLIRIYKEFYARLGLFSIQLRSNNTYTSFGTGVFSPGVDLMLFFRKQSFAPYALTGFMYSTGGGFNSLLLRLGGGVEFIPTSLPIYPYTEVDLDINSTTGHTNTIAIFKLGVRVK
ncbi:MAG: hypothetical protein N2748_01655 [candidate division WOR-3 bacterium]|nr:hypothetical protein [candidate division WOR-3 bacterium]